jgi:FLYWCH zinc finger domain
MVYKEISLMNTSSRSSSTESCSESTSAGLLFTLSNKGKPQLIYNGHIFKCNKTTDKKKYWVCVESGCGIYIHTSGEHNYTANPRHIEVKLVRDKMKEQILSETTSITRISDEEIGKANLSHSATAILSTVVEFRMYS